MASPTDNRVDFIYELKGEQSEMDVFQLAPTLLALGQLIQDSNRALYPDGQEIGVNVKPFREGSFIVDVVLFPASGFHQLLDMVRQMSAHQIKEVLQTLGILAGSTATVLTAIKALRKPAKRIDKLRPNEYRYTSEDNNSITVGEGVHTLLQNPVIINNINNVYAKPLENEGITAVESYLKDEPDTKTIVPKEEGLVITQFTSAAIEAPQETTNETTTEGVYLNPKRGSFDGDGSSWSFHRGDKVITATVKDDKFLGQVASGEIRPNHQDLMKVTLTEKQKVRGMQVKQPSYEIPKVEGYEPGPVQDSLFNSLPSDTPDTEPPKN